MPTFYTNESVHIDVDEFYSEMDCSDKEQMIELLQEDGLLPDVEQVADIRVTPPTSYLEEQLLESFKKIWNNKVAITNKDIKLLDEMSKKTLYHDMKAAGYDAC